MEFRKLDPRSKNVLITGASTGLGRAAALHLRSLGFRVFAGVRSESSAAELSQVPVADPLIGEIIPLLLDVTEAASIDRAGTVVKGACGDTGLWALVNNAGIAVCAPLECVPPEVLRLQLETNFVGALAVIQRFLPLFADVGRADRQRKLRPWQCGAAVSRCVRSRSIRQGGHERCAAP
ncbi:SDR family NAD(P)-dependent oxidoreductase [Mycobacterium bourgelatii]|uniref:SDR family NAD(P)-dependent oxidoreductase n=1 Tax=Mycobacterium bourgelatii TaxID=1273442 RepID=UPI0021F32E31|nr:SDR family NAD(P)-dependent oxidoreductase [Mycobacterium bourgelatii]